MDEKNKFPYFRIVVKFETAERLQKHKRLKESWDDVITRLLDKYEGSE